MTPTDLQRDMVAPERFCVAHPFNPVYLLPWSSSSAARKRRLPPSRQPPILHLHRHACLLRVRREVPGHLTDRLQEAIWREILHMVPDIKGVAGKFIEALVDQESDLLFANKIRPKVEAEIDKIALEAGQQELEKFTAMQTEDQDAQSERLEIEQIHADLTKLEDQIRKEDVIHEMEYRAEHPAEEPE